MNKLYYVKRAKYGKSKTFKKILDVVALYYPYMTPDWRLGFVLQMYYEQAKTRNPYLNLIVYGRDSVHRQLSYFRGKIKDKTLSNNLTLWKKA